MNKYTLDQLCGGCAKNKVCKFINQFENAVKAVQELNFEFPIKVQIVCQEYQNNTGTLRTIEWVNPKEVTCDKTFAWNSDELTSD